MNDLASNPPTYHVERLNSTVWANLNDKYRAAYFNKEYRRSVRDYFDKRFILIWLATFIVHFLTALYFAVNPPNTSIDRSEIDLIQKQFVSLVLEKETVAQSDESKDVPPAMMATKDVGRGTSGSGRGTIRQGGASGSKYAGESPGSIAESTAGGYFDGTGDRGTSQEQISNEVSSKGLLGLLTGSGITAKGEAIKDVLGDAASSQGDLDQVLGNLDGLKRTGKLSRGSGTGGGGYGAPPGTLIQKGARATTGGGIDNLISGKENIKSMDFKRKGNIVVEEISVVADDRGFKSESRNPDQVSEIVNGHNQSIQYCYQRELKQNPDLKGKLVVRFTINPEGKVKEVKIISSTLDSPSIERCVISRILRWDNFGAIDPIKGDAVFKQVYTFGY